jgi:CheY-like chemotaxis protein
MIRNHPNDLAFARQGVDGPQALVETPLSIPPQLGLLVVAANARVRAMLYLVMRKYGVAVWVATTGPEALAQYERQRGHIDLVLLDAALPPPGAVQTLRALRAADPQVRFCLLGECKGGDAVQDQTDWKVERCFPLPLRLEEMVQELCVLAASPRGPAAGAEAPAPVADAAKPPGAERRVAARHLCHWEARCHALGHGAPGQGWPGRLRDISLSGVRVLVDRRFEVGTCLALELPTLAGGLAPWLLACVTRVARTQEEGWELGCPFIRRLTEEELHTLFV